MSCQKMKKFCYEKEEKKNGKSFKLKDEKQKQTNKGSGFKGIQVFYLISNLFLTKTYL